MNSKIQKVIRVFPRCTSYTPDDDMAFIGRPPLIRPEADEVHISCTFTWDKPVAEDLARDWAKYYPVVKIGGPAYDDSGGEFMPGRYLRQGEVITSRGCPNKCSFCFVPKREGKLRLLEIKEGWDIVDNNLLACPKHHVESVFDMLSKQTHKVMFRGGIEARRVDEWFVSQLSRVKLERLFMAFDKPADEKAVKDAIKLLHDANYNHRHICCYVLVGYKNDTVADALCRLEWIKELGAMPFAMYFRDNNDNGKTPPREWQKIIKPYSRPTAIFGVTNEVKEMRVGQGVLFH